MIPSIMCHVPPSVELSGPRTPQFSNPDPQPPRFQTRLMPLAVKESLGLVASWEKLT